MKTLITRIHLCHLSILITCHKKKLASQVFALI